MKTSRQIVLDTVRAQRVVTARDLSRLLQMTEANARHHLHLLAAQGLVKVSGRRQAGGKGRPLLLYSLSEEASGHNLGGLAGALLEELLKDRTPEERIQFLGRLAGKFRADGQGNNDSSDGESRRGAAEFQDKKEYRRGETLTQRLYQAVRQLNRLHYEARWEARAFAPRLIFEQCPYAAIIAEHPELCQMDRLLLEQLTGAAVEQTAKLQADRRGVRQCIFSLRVEDR